MNSIRHTLLFLASFALAASVFGQSVYWVPSSGTLQKGKANRIALHFEGCQPTSNFAVPQVANLNLFGAGNQQQTSIVNGRYLTKTIINYRATPGNVSNIQIPQFNIETDKGEINVDAAAFTVVEATIGDTGLKPEEVFYSEIKPDDDKVYMGEIFRIRYLFGLKQSQQITNLSPPQWNPDNLVIREFSEYETVRFTAGPNSEQYNGAQYYTEGLANQAGDLNIVPADQVVTVVVGRQRGFFSFNENITEEISLSTDPIQIEIHPLPNNAPPSFTGAVGDFTLDSKIVPEEVQVGEPVTWTLTLSGKGNWPQGVGIPARPKPADFRNIQPNLKTEHPEDNPFQATQTEDIILIPTKAGEYQIGPVEFSYFDPETETYKTAIVPAKTVRINSVASTSPLQSNPLGNTDGTPQSPTFADREPTGISIADKPIDLPRDAATDGYLATIATGKVPGGKLLLIPIVPACAWLFIALARSFLLDPNKQRRLAHQTLKEIASQPTPTDQEAIKALHRKWRRASKTYWQMQTEEPTTEEIRLAVSKSSTPNQADTWAQLWANSDRALFGPSQEGADQWMDEFRSALEKLPRPRVSLSKFASQPAWAPALCILGIAAFSSTEAEANEALAYYNEGQFEKASELWLERLQEEPNNWAHRYNLGLCFAQKEDWGRALAYWTSAYTLNPRQDDVNWNAQLALTKTGAYYEPFRDIVEKSGTSRIVGELSPAEWESLYAKCILLAIVFLLIWVISRYVKNARKFATPAVALAGLCFAIALLSMWAHRQYGYLASPNAVIIVAQTELKTIPADLPEAPPAETDADAPPLSTPLAEGSIGLLKKEFLGWSQLELPNGESGWIRKQFTVPLYGSIDRI